MRRPSVFAVRVLGDDAAVLGRVVVVTSSTTSPVKPAPSMVLMALASVRPTTDGTALSAGPVDTTTVTARPFGRTVSAGGSVRMTRPSSTVSDASDVWFTVKPAWPSRFDASAIGLADHVGHRTVGRALRHDERDLGAAGRLLARPGVLVDDLADGRLLVGDLLLLHREALPGEQLARLLHLASRPRRARGWPRRRRSP